MAKLRGLTEVELGTARIKAFRSLVDADEWTRLTATMGRLADLMRGRTFWNVNSTARGGGVAEMLASLISYDRDAGIDERWLVIEGDAGFFEVTKKLHNLLHGTAPSGEASLSENDRRVYERTTARNAAALADHVRAGDFVLLHDPQTAGLVRTLKERGACVVWRSHVGVDVPNQHVREAWRFLVPYVDRADALVFSRRAYVWDGLERSRVQVIPPCIDPFSPKNRELDASMIDKLLGQASLPNRVRYVLQVSRWDRLKDPEGLLEAFAEHMASRSDACLVLAGPAATAVDDDPEQPEILKALGRRRESLPSAVRDRVLLAQLPMDDIDRNALMVNALQRRADVVVQKSLAEGFGLTVAEAMWKSRPVVASRVGGIEDQIEDGRSGLLVDDPRDLRAFGDAVVEVLANPAKAQALGGEARRRVTRHFITPGHMVAQGRLILEVAGR